MHHHTIQRIWAVLLTLAGIGVFIRIPQVMPAIKSIPAFSGLIWFIYICFYLLGGLLIWGGIQKWLKFSRKPDVDTDADKG